MRSIAKWTGAGALALLATSAIAADHGDGADTTLDTRPEADINDLYAWVKSDNQTLVMIMTIGALSAPDFSPGVQYVFHVGRQADDANALTAPAASWTDIICEFNAAQEVSCWAGQSAYVTGDASADAGIANDDGSFKVHTGQHADPFFFYLQGFQTAVATVNAVGASLTPVGNGGCPDTSGAVTLDPTNGCFDVDPAIGVQTETVGGVLRGILNGTYADANCTAGTGPVNDFETLNVSAIVVEMDLSHIDGTGDFLQVWSSTHEKG